MFFSAPIKHLLVETRVTGHPGMKGRLGASVALRNSRTCYRTAAVGRMGTNARFFPIVSHGCGRRIFFLVFVVNCQRADKNQLGRRQTVDLDIDSVHGQRA